MQARSASSTKLDAYDAGRELGAALAEINPELVVVFSSIHYDFAELHEGLVDALDRDDVQVFGGTGDGFFETGSSGAVGVSALGLASDGTLQFHTHVEENLGSDSQAVARRCARAVVDAAGDQPVRLAMVLFDGLSCKENRVIEGVNEVLDCPVFGGIVSDDRKMERCLVIHGGQVYSNAVGVLGFCGELAFAIAVESGACPVGSPGLVEAAGGNTLERIAGMSALEFTAERLGKSSETFTEQDIGVINFECAAAPDMRDPQYRSIYEWREENGALGTFGPVEVGQYVRVAMVTSDELLTGAHTVVDSFKDLDFKPAAALAISCAGRKWFLGARFEEEAEIIRAGQPQLPFIGFPSLGELAPRRRDDASYSGNLFHNISLVVALIGTPNSASNPA